MRCVLCGNVIALQNEATIPTSSGELVHLMCADREAQSTWKCRQCWALLHAFCGIAMTISAWLSDLRMWWLALGIAASHLLLHRRWWYYVSKDIRRWLYS